MSIAMPLGGGRVRPHLNLPAPARLSAVAGLAVLALVPISLAGLAFDPRGLDAGHLRLESVWLKPLKFQLSVGVHLVAVGLCLTALAGRRGTDRATRVLVGILVASGVAEVAYITARGALGLRSHFATDPLGIVAYQLMGAGAVAIVVVTAIFGLRVLRERPGGMAPHLHLAAGLGLLISGVAGLVTGAAIGANDGPLVGASPGAVLPLFGWSSTGGDLRVAHFFGIHAVQLLPLLALAIGARGPGQRRAAVWAGAAALVAVTALTLAQALGGRPFLVL